MRSDELNAVVSVARLKPTVKKRRLSTRREIVASTARTLAPEVFDFKFFFLNFSTCALQFTIFPYLHRSNQLIIAVVLANDTTMLDALPDTHLSTDSLEFLWFGITLNRIRYAF